VESLTQVCPWANFEAATSIFCERRLCHWIVEPANTWSNISYFIAAIIIFRQNRNSKNSELNLIALTAFLVGIGSTLFHATGTRWGEIIDVSAMYLISSLFIVFGLRRSVSLSKIYLVIVYALLAGLSSLFLLLSRSSGIKLFALHITLAGLLEIFYFRKTTVKANYKFMRYMVIGFSVAYTSWFLDFHGILCNPDNHVLGGHAIWHLINATCLWSYFKYQEQFSASPASR